MILRGNETYAAEIPDGGGISSRFFRKCSGLESAVLDVEVPAYIWVISLVGRREEGRGGRGRIAKGGGRDGRDEKDEKEVEEEK